MSSSRFWRGSLSFASSSFEAGGGCESGFADSVCLEGDTSMDSSRGLDSWISVTSCG